MGLEKTSIKHLKGQGLNLRTQGEVLTLGMTSDNIKVSCLLMHHHLLELRNRLQQKTWDDAIPDRLERLCTQLLRQAASMYSEILWILKE